MEKRMVFLAIVMVMAVFMGCTQVGIQPTAPATGIDSGVIVPALPQPVVTAPTGEVVQEPTVEVSSQGDIYAKITLNEGELVKLDLQASDPDGDPLTYRFSSPLNNKGEWQTKIGDAGEYPVKITVSDGKLETSKTIMLIVKAVNRKPIIEQQPDITVVEGQKLVLNLKATDPDDDVLVWKYETPILADGTWQTKIGDAGEYTIKATVSDGYVSESTTFKVKVLKLNHPPTLEIAKEMTVNEGDTIKLAPKVSDEDGDSVTVSYSGWMSSDTYTTNFEDAGRHQVVVTASDGKTVESAVVWVTVNNVNRAPVISGLIVK
jgi:hypothetical protein